jgi:hypothetical protein
MTDAVTRHAYDALHDTAMTLIGSGVDPDAVLAAALQLARNLLAEGHDARSMVALVCEALVG